MTARIARMRVPATLATTADLCAAVLSTSEV